MNRIDETRPSLLNDWQDRSDELVPEGGTGGWKRYVAMFPDEGRSLINEQPSPPRLVLLAGGKK
jgi:hypothetical protein